MRLIRFFHKVFKPNCECMVCSEPACLMCAERQRLLDIEKNEKSALLKALLDMQRPLVIKQEDDAEKEPLEPIRGAQRWSNMRRTLEEKDRLLADEQRAAKQVEDNRRREQVKIEMDKIKPMTEDDIDAFLKDDDAEDKQPESAAV